MSRARSRPAVFLDRDGTLNREVEGALARPEQLEILPGVVEGLVRLRDAGYVLVVVSNQSAIARGWADPLQVAQVNQALCALLASEGAGPDAIYVCPHHPDEGLPPYRRVCGCRKPASGLLVLAAGELDLDLTRSWVIGDAERDLVAGVRLGLPGVLLLSGKGPTELECMRIAGREPPFVAQDLRSAAELVLAQGR